MRAKRTGPAAAPSTFTRPASTCDEAPAHSLLPVNAREPGEVKVALSQFALIALSALSELSELCESASASACAGFDVGLFCDEAVGREEHHVRQPGSAGEIESQARGVREAEPKTSPRSWQKPARRCERTSCAGACQTRKLCSPELLARPPESPPQRAGLFRSCIMP